MFPEVMVTLENNTRLKSGWRNRSSSFSHSGKEMFCNVKPASSFESRLLLLFVIIFNMFGLNQIRRQKKKKDKMTHPISRFFNAPKKHDK